jgi:hypothetical protein
MEEKHGKTSSNTMTTLGMDIIVSEKTEKEIK